MATVNARKLDEGTEPVAFVRVSMEVRHAIQKARLEKKMSESELAKLINEQPKVVQEYENGKAVPNQVVMAKMEKVLRAKLRGKGPMNCYFGAVCGDSTGTTASDLTASTVLPSLQFILQQNTVQRDISTIGEILWLYCCLRKERRGMSVHSRVLKSSSQKAVHNALNINMFCCGSRLRNRKGKCIMEWGYPVNTNSTACISAINSYYHQLLLFLMA